MYIFLSILIVIACVLLIGVVLIQKSKGGGLASDYSSGNQFLGYRKTTDFVEKATWSLAIFICIISIFASFAIRGNHYNHSAIAPSAPQQTAAPAATENPAAQPAAPVAPDAKAETNAPATDAKADAPAPAPAKADDAAKAEAPAADKAETPEAPANK